MTVDDITTRTLCKSFKTRILGFVFVFMWGELGLSHKGDSKSLGRGSACACVHLFHLQTSIFCEPPTVYSHFSPNIYTRKHSHVHKQTHTQTHKISLYATVTLCIMWSLCCLHLLGNKQKNWISIWHFTAQERGQKGHRVWKRERDTLKEIPF